MFKFFKRNKEKEIKEYTPSPSELDHIAKLSEKLSELKSAYSLIENRALKFKKIDNPKLKSEVNISNSLKLFNDEIGTHINFMSNNNSNKIYSDMIIEFDNLGNSVDKLMTEVYGPNSTIKK